MRSRSSRGSAHTKQCEHFATSARGRQDSICAQRFVRIPFASGFHSPPATFRGFLRPHLATWDHGSLPDSTLHSLESRLAASDQARLAQAFHHLGLGTGLRPRTIPHWLRPSLRAPDLPSQAQTFRPRPRPFLATSDQSWQLQTPAGSFRPVLAASDQSRQLQTPAQLAAFHP